MSDATSLSPLIHVVDDDEAVRNSLALLIGTVGLRVRTWSAPEDFLIGFDPDSVCAVLLDALQKAVRRHVRSRARHTADRAARQRFGQLSAREHEVLGLIVEGLTNKEIARALGVSPRTVETHRANLFAKLEVGSLAQLIRHYAGLVEEGDAP